MEKTKIRIPVSYEGNNINHKGLVSLKVRVDLEEIQNVIKLFMMIEKLFKLGVEKTVIGTFTLNKITVDKFGDSVIEFRTITDDIDINKIPILYRDEKIDLKLVEIIQNDE